MRLSWEDFEEAIGEDGHVHVHQKSEKISLCGPPLTDRAVESQRVCPLCRSLRRDAIAASDEPPDEG